MKNKYFLYMYKYVYKIYHILLLWPQYLNKLIWVKKRIWVKAIYRVLRSKILDTFFWNIKSNMLKSQHYYPRFFFFKNYIRRNKYVFKFKRCWVKPIICFYLLKKQYLLFNINTKYIKKSLIKKKKNLNFLSKKYLKSFYIYLYKIKKIPQSLWFSPTSLRYNKSFLYKKIYSNKKQITMKVKNSLFLNINNVTGIFRNFFKRYHTKLTFFWIKQIIRKHSYKHFLMVTELQPIILLFRAQFHFSIYFLERLFFLHKILINKNSFNINIFLFLIRPLDSISFTNDIIWAIKCYNFTIQQHKKILKKKKLLKYNLFIFNNFFQTATFLKFKKKKVSLVSYLKQSSVPNYLEISFILFILIYCLTSDQLNILSIQNNQRRILDTHWLI